MAKIQPEGLHGGTSGHVVGAVFGSMAAGVIEAVVTLFKKMSADAHEPVVALGVWLLAFFVATFCALAIHRYLTVLDAGASPEDEPERQAYERLRGDLAVGGWPARFYARLLTRIVSIIDRFMGDGAPNSATPARNIIGFKFSEPFWTARAFERSLLLTFIYPAGTIFLVWLVLGQWGTAAQALSLPKDVSLWLRSLLAAGFAFELYLLWHYRKGDRFSLLWMAAAGLVAGCLMVFTGNALLTVLLAVGAAVAITGSAAGTIAVAFVIAALLVNTLVIDLMASAVFPVAHLVETSDDVGKSVYFGLALAIVLLVPLTVFLFDIARANAGRNAAIFAACVGVGRVFGAMMNVHLPLIFVPALAMISAGMFLIACAAGAAAARFVVAWGKKAAEKSRDGRFLAIYSIAAIAICFAMAFVIPRIDTVPEPDGTLGGPTLFLGLLPLLSAPFLWLAVGMTRFLMRRGIAMGGWWPYLLAAGDAIFASVLLVLLAIVLTLGYQAFASIAVAGDVKPVYAVSKVIADLSAGPARSESWWICIVLFSVLIPSVFHLAVAGASLTRGIPALSALVLSRMPSASAVPKLDRLWISLALTAQWLVGALLGIGALAFLAFGIVGWILPEIGLGLRDLATAVVAYDLPGKFAALL
jgi:hypothetical protein